MPESLIESRRLAVHGLVLAVVGALLFFFSSLALGAKQSIAFALLPVAVGMLSVGTTVFAGSLADKFSATKVLLWLAAVVQMIAAVIFGLEFLDALPLPRTLFPLAMVLPMLGASCYFYADAMRIRLQAFPGARPTAVALLAVAALLTVAAVVLSVSAMTFLHRANLWVLVASVFSQLLVACLAANFVVKARSLSLSQTNTPKEAFWFRWLGGARLACGLLLIAAGIYFGLWQRPVATAPSLFGKLQLAVGPAMASAIGLHWSFSGALNLAGRYPWIPVSLGSGIGIAVLFWSVVVLAS